MKSLAALLIALMVWTVGLMAFAARVDRSTPAADPPRADGIVVLTGGGTARINAGIKLLEQEKGERLLVSGVNPEVTRDELQEVSSAAKGLFDCCVQLGFYAADTRGNAAETRAWAENEGYHSLIVVTSDYHMPRAFLEMEGALPGFELTAYPIQTPELDAERWWRTSGGARRMILEYCKYLLVLSREMFLSLGPDQSKPEKTPDAKAP